MFFGIGVSLVWGAFFFVPTARARGDVRLFCVVCGARRHKGVCAPLLWFAGFVFVQGGSIAPRREVWSRVV